MGSFLIIVRIEIKYLNLNLEKDKSLRDGMKALPKCLKGKRQK